MNKKQLEELRYAIRHMTRQQGIWKVLKEELTAQGRWRTLPRGDPKLGYKNMKASKDNVEV